jgi:predicted nucleic acid-binding protein
MLQKIQVTTQTNTRAGDALHLSVAMQCEAKAFATLDNAQAASAKQLGFMVDMF